MIGVLYFTAAGIAFAGYWLYVSRKNARAQARRRSRFVSRETLPQSEWFRRYFAESGIDELTAVALYGPIARSVGCSLTQLRPEDAFDTSLAFGGVTFLGIDDDDPLSNYAECDLPQIVGDEQRANDVVERVRNEPTLRALALAVASTT